MKTRCWVQKTVVIAIIIGTFAAFGMQVRAGAIREQRVARPKTRQHTPVRPGSILPGAAGMRLSSGVGGTRPVVSTLA